MTRSCSLFVAVLLPFLQPSQEGLEYWPLGQYNDQAKPEKNEGPGHFCKQVAGSHMGYRCAHHRRSDQQSPNSRQKIRTDAEQQQHRATQLDHIRNPVVNDLRSEQDLPSSVSTDMKATGEIPSHLAFSITIL